MEGGQAVATWPRFTPRPSITTTRPSTTTTLKRPATEKEPSPLGTLLRFIPKPLPRHLLQQVPNQLLEPDQPMTLPSCTQANSRPELRPQNLLKNPAPESITCPLQSTKMPFDVPMTM